jgi:aryl-alcohol dehydrogenase-like predicted oxidoreductase
MKLGLGTVQFGLPYGITNTEGQVSQTDTLNILTSARKFGIDLLDTATAYGSSEERLGVCLKESDGLDSSFRIITKTIPLNSRHIGKSDVKRVEQGFYSSLQNLNQSCVDGLLVHHAEDLLVPGGELLYESLQQLKNEGRIKKLGVSVYNGTQIEAILKRYTIDLIQLPVNVFDQRLLTSGLIAELKRQGVEIHVRSIFLQGVLLAEIENIPEQLKPYQAIFNRFDEAVRASGLSRLTAVLGFIESISDIDYAIVGALSVDQLKSICDAKESLSKYRVADLIDYACLAVDDEKLINPGLWK